MRRTASSRILAVLLAALFIGGVGGASDLDALLFHGAGDPGAAAAHFESGGIANHHADNCLLTLRVASGRGSLPLGSPVRFEGIPQRTAAPRPVAVPRSFHPGFHQDSRAPPASVA
jgi:hypothetical protein